ncbi:MAG: pyridoxal phosphate-dependent aminotransferase family protein, partial [Verrucomicrobia bacterium]|nr:pyridoxal phosphate-dependent aminotransferase family protein [Cytophagales bacterium]
PQLRKNLWTIVHAIQEGFRERGYDIGGTDTPVTPVFMYGQPNEVMNLIIDLRENYGIFCSAVTYPVVPKGVILLRIIPTAVHTLADVERTLQAFDAVAEKLKSGIYANQTGVLESVMA